MAGIVLFMSFLDIIKLSGKLKDLCFKNRHKTIYLPLWAIKTQKPSSEPED